MNNNSAVKPGFDEEVGEYVEADDTIFNDSEIDINENMEQNLDETADFLLEDLKIGVVFPNQKTAERALRHWCDENFCPLAKVI